MPRRARARRARRSPAPRASTCTRHRWRLGRMRRMMSRSAEIPATPPRPQIRLELGLDGSGAGTRDDRRRVPRPHARPARPPRPPGPRRRGHRRPADRRAPHRRGHRPRHSGRRSTTALGDRAGITATATRSCRWTRRARCARSTSPAVRCSSSTPSCRPAAPAGFDHELRRGVLPRGRQHARS